MNSRYHITEEHKPMKTGDIVKYSKPMQGEHDLRFIVIEHNGDRVMIQLVCDYRIKPVEVLSTDEIKLAN